MLTTPRSFKLLAYTGVPLDNGDGERRHRSAQPIGNKRSNETSAYNEDVGVLGHLLQLVQIGFKNRSRSKMAKIV